MHFICYTTFHCACGDCGLTADSSVWQLTARPLCNHPHMVTTWASSFPKTHFAAETLQKKKKKKKKKCVLRSVRHNCLPTDAQSMSCRLGRLSLHHNSRRNAHCGCQKNANTRRGRMNDAQAKMHLTKTTSVLNLWCESRRKQASLRCHVTYCCLLCHSQERPSHLAVCLVLRSLLLNLKKKNGRQTNRWDSPDTLSLRL